VLVDKFSFTVFIQKKPPKTYQPAQKVWFTDSNLYICQRKSHLSCNALSVRCYSQSPIKKAINNLKNLQENYGKMSVALAEAAMLSDHNFA